MSLELTLASILVLVIVGVITTLFLASRFLGPQDKDNPLKNTAYESGVTNPIGTVKQVFNIKFYLVAILFVIFDVEVVFMLPWAVNLRELGVFGLVEMFVFMALLVVGLIYVYKSKALAWV